MKTQLLFTYLFVSLLGTLQAQFTDTVLDQLLASDGAAGNAYGYAVAIDDDRIVVGAPYKGQAYVYDLVGATWQETIITPTFMPMTGVYNTFFGWDVALDGDRIVVGMTDEICTASGWGPGTVYVYDLVGGVWQETVLTASDTNFDDESFGWSVAIDGNRIVVGAPRDDGANIGSTDEKGAAYIYDLVGGVWQETKIVATNGGDYDNFGWDVDIAGNRVIVGAPKYVLSVNCEGSVYIYDLMGGTWQESIELVASDGSCLDEFGYAICLADSGNRIVSGAPASFTSSVAPTGSIYIYDFVSVNNWSETKIVSSDITSNDDFGWAVDLDGDKLVTGTLNADKTYLYQLSGSTWNETILTAFDDNANNDRFGSAVAIDGGTVLIGADWHDNINSTNAGSIYVYDCSALISPCPSTLYVSTPMIPNGTYQAQVSVTSDQTVPANGTVIFDAGNEIILNPGFQTDMNVLFCAIIQGCMP